MFKLDRRCSVSHEMTIRNIDTASIIQRKLTFSMYIRLLRSENYLLRNVIERDIFVYSILCKKWFNDMFKVGMK